MEGSEDASKLATLGAELARMVESSASESSLSDLASRQQQQPVAPSPLMRHHGVPSELAGGVSLTVPPSVSGDFQQGSGQHQNLGYNSLPRPVPPPPTAPIGGTSGLDVASQLPSLGLMGGMGLLGEFLYVLPCRQPSLCE